MCRYPLRAHVRDHLKSKEQLLEERRIQIIVKWPPVSFRMGFVSRLARDMKSSECN